MKFFKNFSPFQKVFFLFFYIFSIIVFFLPAFIPGGSLSNILTTIGIIGLICTLSGVLVSIYTAKAHIVGYVWWMINAVTTGIIGLYNSLYGQFILNIFITLPLLIYGFIAWKKNMALNNSKDIVIRKFNLKQWIIALISSVIIWISYGLFLTYLPNIAYNLFNIHISKDPQIILDSFTCVMTIMATYLTGKRYIEQWLFWIVFNSISIIMFVIQSIGVSITNPSMLVADFSDILSLLQYIIGVTYGYILWRKIMKEKNYDSKSMDNEENIIYY